MKNYIYAFLFSVLFIGAASSVRAQESVETPDADTAIGAVNSTLNDRVMPKLDGIQTSVSSPTDVIGKFSSFGKSTNIPTTQLPQMEGEQTSGVSATEFSTGQDSARASDEAAGMINGGNIQQKQLDRFEKIDANIVGGAATDADAFGQRYADADAGESALNGETSLIEATAKVGALQIQVAKSVDLVGLEVANVAKAIGAVSAERNQQAQRITDDHKKTALEFATVP